MSASRSYGKRMGTRLVSHETTEREGAGTIGQAFRLSIQGRRRGVPPSLDPGVGLEGPRHADREGRSPHASAKATGPGSGRLSDLNPGAARSRMRRMGRAGTAAQGWSRRRVNTKLMLGGIIYESSRHLVNHCDIAPIGARRRVGYGRATPGGRLDLVPSAALACFELGCCKNVTDRQGRVVYEASGPLRMDPKR